MTIDIWKLNDALVEAKAKGSFVYIDSITYKKPAKKRGGGTIRVETKNVRFHAESDYVKAREKKDEEYKPAMHKFADKVAPHIWKNRKDVTKMYFGFPVNPDVKNNALQVKYFYAQDDENYIPITKERYDELMPTKAEGSMIFRQYKPESIVSFRAVGKVIEAA